MSPHTPNIPIPELVAHRGYAARYPENSLEGIEAALRAGARYVEFDVQLSADGVPVVIHDAELLRTAGVEGSVLETPLAELRRLEVNEKARLGTAFSGIRLPTLQEMVELLRSWPQVHAFVELKRTSLRRFGVETMVESVLKILRPIHEQCVIISFDAQAILASRAHGAQAVGWVFEGWDDEIRRSAEALAPDYLFCDHERLPPSGEPLWPGPWRWALYEITSAALAVALAARGAHLIETMAIGELLADPRLHPGAAFG